MHSHAKTTHTPCVSERDAVLTWLQGTVPGVVMPGAYVRVALLDVPEAAAARACDRVSAFLLGAAPPTVAIGLGKHESKLTVVNMVVKRIPGYEAPVANKEAVTLITGMRTFDARPVLSTNDYNADKFKLEKFMHAGRTYVMSVFAPIAFPPLPVLVVKQARLPHACAVHLPIAVMHAQAQYVPLAGDSVCFAVHTSVSRWHASKAHTGMAWLHAACIAPPGTLAGHVPIRPVETGLLTGT